jgi:galactonate dehydratase
MARPGIGYAGPTKGSAMKIAEVESLVGGGGQFVRITTDSGLVGLGQSACWGYPSAVHEVVQTFREYLIGKDPLQI